jgi:hypothetical protein
LKERSLQTYRLVAYARILDRFKSAESRDAGPTPVAGSVEQASESVLKTEIRLGNHERLVGAVREPPRNEGAASGAPTSRTSPDAILRHSRIAWAQRMGNPARNAGRPHQIIYSIEHYSWQPL